MSMSRIGKTPLSLFTIKDKPISVNRKPISAGIGWVEEAQRLHSEMQKATATGNGYMPAFVAIYEHLLDYEPSLKAMRDDILDNVSHEEMLEAFFALVDANDPLLGVQKIDERRFSAALEKFQGIPQSVVDAALKFNSVKET